MVRRSFLSSLLCARRPRLSEHVHLVRLYWTVRANYNCEIGLVISLININGTAGDLRFDMTHVTDVSSFFFSSSSCTDGKCLLSLNRQEGLAARARARSRGRKRTAVIPISKMRTRRVFLLLCPSGPLEIRRRFSFARKRGEKTRGPGE